jgi:hypothetical protein
MPFTKSVGRQYLLVAEAEIKSTDLVSGVALPIIDLPPGAVVHGGTVRCTGTAFDSASSDALVIGDAGSANRYLASNTTVLRTSGATAEFVNTAPGYKSDAKSAVQVTWTSTGGLTATDAKSFKVYVRYSVEGKAVEVQT